LNSDERHCTWLKGIKKHRSMKIFNTIGCCGIDCGLCPRFYTKGDSACPGCDGPNFKQKHPTCGYVTCCVIKNGSEVCSECKDYPCNRFDSEKYGYDSFVTHKRVFPNLDFIKKNGMDSFINQQQTRMDILKYFLAHYDDGRSKSFFCISCTLLPLDELQDAKVYLKNIKDSKNNMEKSKLLKDRLLKIASELRIELKLMNN
jgi:hypothetical protein